MDLAEAGQFGVLERIPQIVFGNIPQGVTGNDPVDNDGAYRWDRVGWRRGWGLRGR